VTIPVSLFVSEIVAFAPLAMTPLKLMLPSPLSVNVLFPLPVAVVFEVKVRVKPVAFAVIVPPDEVDVVLLKSMTLFVVSSAVPTHRIEPALVPAPSWIVAFVPKALLEPALPIAVTTTVPSSIFMPPLKLLLVAELRSSVPWLFFVIEPFPEITPELVNVLPVPTRNVPAVATEMLFESVAEARAERVPFSVIAPVPRAELLLNCKVPEEIVVTPE